MITSLLYSSRFLSDEQLLIVKLKGAGGGGGTLISKASTQGAYHREQRNSEGHGEYLI